MSKQDKPVATLDSKGRAAIVRSVADAVKNIGGTGNLVTQVCAAARAHCGGTQPLPLSSDDIDDIISTVAKTDTLKAMNPRSRTNTLGRWSTVLHTYVELPKAEQALREKVGRAAWHDVMALAVCLKKGNTIAEAVKEIAARMNGKAGASAEPTTSKEAKARVIIAFKRMVALPKLSPELAKALRVFAAEHDLSI